MGKKFLVTGATGFVGSALARRLIKEGNDVHILTRRQSDKWRIADILKDLKECEVDLTRSSDLEKALSRIKPDIIYHCAAYGVRPGQHDASRSGEVNMMGTINLMTALMKTGFSCMVHTGSSAEYGHKGRPFVETDIPEPVTAYGATKAGSGLFCQAVARAHKLPILIARLMSPYGPYDEPNRLIPAVITKCLRGMDPELSPGTESRSFFYMDDLIDFYLSVPGAKTWGPGEIVNVGCAEQYSVRDIATRIIKLTGAKVKPLFGALPPRDFDTDYWVADVSKVKSLFGWAAKIDIDEGLRRTIEWYRTNYAIKD